MAHKFVTDIDAEVERRNSEEFPFRFHLGGSLIGRSCLRAIWYSFRWAKKPAFKGRILRLFDRGHKEEFRFVEYLTMLGIDVQAYSEKLIYNNVDDKYYTLPWEAVITDPADGMDVTTSEWHIKRAEAMGCKLKQWQISGVDGHFGGSLDGEATRVPGFDPQEKFLCEFKTHNTNSFKKLVVEYVKIAKPEHYAQMQTYMAKRKLKNAIYVAVNKNDDDLYIEIVPYEPGFGEGMEQKAEKVIRCKQPPARESNHAAAFGCKFCDYLRPCHFGEPMEKNCRTCQFSEPVVDGQWHCSHWNTNIPKEAQLIGCENHKAITD